MEHIMPTLKDISKNSPALLLSFIFFKYSDLNIVGWILLVVGIIVMIFNPIFAILLKRINSLENKLDDKDKLIMEMQQKKF